MSQNLKIIRGFLIESFMKMGDEVSVFKRKEEVRNKKEVCATEIGHIFLFFEAIKVIKVPAVSVRRVNISFILQLSLVLH
jgi:hypothetical protein